MTGTYIATLRICLNIEHSSCVRLSTLGTIYVWSCLRQSAARMAYSSPPEGQLNGLQVQNRHPALRDQTLLGHIQVKQVQCVIDGFDLAHFHEPVLDVFCSSNQDSVSVVLSLTQNLETVQWYSVFSHISNCFL
jgi:hypothetical protein